jgi:phosphoglucosamine mutase
MGLSELCQDLKIFPQLLKNVKVNDKKSALVNPQLKELIALHEQSLHGEGRILVRPSGTEPLVRVMVEAASEEICARIVDDVVAKIIELKL